MSAADDHATALAHAFAEVLRAEEQIRDAKTELDEATNVARLRIGDGEAALSAAWAGVAALMADSGEYELTLPGDAFNYLIRWSKPRESVRVEADAVPDRFVKLEKKPKLKEIGDHLKALRAAGAPSPNWARFERGEPSLTWKAVKK